MVKKEKHQHKCKHISRILSSLKASGVIFTGSQTSNFIAEVYCEECQRWCFGVEVGSYDRNTKTYDYGKDLVLMNIIDQDSIDEKVLNKKLLQEHKELYESLKRCCSTGCLEMVFRGKKKCAGERLCVNCQAAEVLKKIGIKS